MKARQDHDINAERRILADHLRAVPRFFSKPKVRMFSADDVVVEIEGLSGSPDEYIKSLESAKTCPQCTVCLLRTDSLDVLIEHQ